MCGTLASPLRWSRLVLFGFLFTATAVSGYVNRAAPPEDGDHGQRADAKSEAILNTRDGYLWPYESGPFYGSLPESKRRARGVVHTLVGSFDLTLGTPDFPAELRAREDLDRQAHRYYIVMLDTEALNGELELLAGRIEGAGGSVIERLPAQGMIARLNAEARDLVQATPALAALEPYHPAFKLSPGIGRAPLADPRDAASEVYDLDVLLFRGEDSRVVARAATDLGADIVYVTADSLRLEIHRSRLAALAALEPVRAIFEHLPAHVMGEEISATIQTGGFAAGANPYHDAGIDGGGGGIATGQILMVLDTGIQLDAGDLSDTHDTTGEPGNDCVNNAAANCDHRKVVLYESTDQFGGEGDERGCDDSLHGGWTHGHAVSAVALGWATDVVPPYGESWGSPGNRGLDGVAPGGRLVAYDGQVTPPFGTCGSQVSPGQLFPGSLDHAYGMGARTFNLSWNTGEKIYATPDLDVDEFLSSATRADAMLFVSASNTGRVTSPAHAKNAVVVGASLTNQPESNEEKRAIFSSIGPAGYDDVCGSDLNRTDCRTAPILMAPGADVAGTDAESAVSCRSTDDDQDAAVECLLNEARSGTSFASAAAAGAAMLVRDYFAQGFHPDGTSQDANNAADLVPDISGALVKATLVASADWMNDPDDPKLPGENLTADYRFNNEQGYGRITLTHVLPLGSFTSGTPLGLRVVDGGLAGGVNDLGMTDQVDAVIGDSVQATFDVCDDLQELRVALAWIDKYPGFGVLNNDLDLELESPSGFIYRGNYFTDDHNKTGVLGDGGTCSDPSNAAPCGPAVPCNSGSCQNDPETGGTDEDCPDQTGATGARDTGPWSLAVQTSTTALCGNAKTDSVNPVEAIFLSPDSDGNGDAAAPFNQIETGTWTVRVKAKPLGTESAQTYALAIAGGFCQSAVILSDERLSCNEKLGITVLETDELVESVISNDTELRVVDPATSTVLDVESFAFTQSAPGSFAFVTDPIVLTESGAPVSGNGLVEVRHGARIEVVYTDEPTEVRVAIAELDCAADLTFGSLLYEQYGRDTAYRIEGGCELNACQRFTNGFPDQHLDSGETLTYGVKFSNDGDTDLENLEARLVAVEVDGDSPKHCRPGSADCPDPDRLNNVACPYVTIQDPSKNIGFLPAGWPGEVRFTITMADFSGTPTCELLTLLSSRALGKTASTILVSRHRLNVDDEFTNYSTDYPSGSGLPGVTVDYNGNGGSPENPICDPGDPSVDGLFETRVWSDLSSGLDESGLPVAVNQGLTGRWDFDSNDGGFRSGMLSGSIQGTTLPANWGEDLNFNGVLDYFCSSDPSIPCNPPFDPGCGPDPTCTSDEDRNPVNGLLDQHWGLSGGCGWQTLAGGQTTGGAWHTGAIGVYNSSSDPFQECAWYTVPIDGGTWAETLLTPVIDKVNQSIDGDGDPAARVQILNFAWNASIDFLDGALLFWELDNDVADPASVDLVGDFNVGGVLRGPFGSISGGQFLFTAGYPLFDTGRSGQNSIFFDTPAMPARLPQPVAGTMFATDNGPIRNMDVRFGSGPDLRNEMFEDRVGEAGHRFQGSLGFVVFGGASQGFGATVDDVVLEWSEITAVEDSGACDLFEPCATIAIDSDTSYDSHGRITITVADPTPAANDCNGDGDRTDVGICSNDPEIVCTDSGNCAGNNCLPDPDFADDLDCDNDDTSDVVVRVVSGSESDGEQVVLNLAGAGAVYRGSLSTTTTHDTEGTILLAANGPGPATITALYEDVDVGTSQPCPSSGHAGLTGWIRAEAQIPVPTGHVIVESYTLTDHMGNGDGDIFADTNETKELCITVSNKSGIDLTGVTATLFTGDPKIDCVQNSTVAVGDLAAGSTAPPVCGFVFKIADVNRSSVAEDFSANLQVRISADEIAMNEVPQMITLDLDLDVIGGSGPGAFAEGFESSTCDDGTPCFSDPQCAGNGSGICSPFGRFTAMPLDEGVCAVDGVTPCSSAADCIASGGGVCNALNSNVLSDGFRCRYTDPDQPAGLSLGQTFCHLGFADPLSNDFDWHPDLERAIEGFRSLHFGVHDGEWLTTRLSQLDAVRTTLPINLGYSGTPELSFKHQISLVDARGAILIEDGGSLDRAVVQVQEVDPAGNAIGFWETIEPFYNIYDVRPTTALGACQFDPLDDGNDEDDRAGTANPFELFGPASTCAPRHVFGYQGDTVDSFVNAIGRASDGPGLTGIGVGTWVETRFNLQRYRGRRLRVRFLVSTAKLADQVFHYPDAGVRSASSADDGWFIDDVNVTNTLDVPATVTVDTNPNGGLAACGQICDIVSADLVGDKTSPVIPGQRVRLSAAGSSAGRCLDGALEVQFWIDGNQNGILAEPDDRLIRGFTQDPAITVTPTHDTTYGVRVRCSSDTTCADDALQAVTVSTPPCTPAPSGTVAWWPLEEAAGAVALDTATADGIAHDGSFTAGVVRDDGWVRRALDFPGSTAQFLEINPGLDLDATAFSLVAWIRPDYIGGPNADYEIVAKGSTGPGEWHLWIDRAAARMKFENSCGVFTHPDPIPHDLWIHAAVTATSSGGTSLYVNGQPAVFGSCVYGASNGQPLRIGSGFRGLIDEVEIYDRELGPGEVQNLVDAGRGGKCPCGDGDSDAFVVCDGCLPDVGDQCGDCNDADSAVSPGEPEVCDSFDNDCNGIINDGLGAVPELCNGLDDNCNGLFDENNPESGPCEDLNRIGVCAYGILFCPENGDGNQSCIFTAPGPEICADGDDNDCDGSTDEPEDPDMDGVNNCDMNGDPLDNCLDATNPPEDCDMNPGTPPEQCDSDGDGLGDACDCDPEPPVVPFTLEVNPGSGSDSVISWAPVSGISQYHLYRGYRNRGTSFEYNQQCLEGNVTGTSGTETLEPRRITLFYYLVTTKCPTSEEQSSLGTDSELMQRPSNPDPATVCPSIDMDLDRDFVVDALDNCPTKNLSQADFDDDGHGDICDNCPQDSNTDQGNLDGDVFGDVCDADEDGDGILDDGGGSGTQGDEPCTGGETTMCDDNCERIGNPMQRDREIAEGLDQTCGTSDDNPQLFGTDTTCGTPDDGAGDGVGNICDNCRDTYNPPEDCDMVPETPPEQCDSDGDGIGDACDSS